MVFWVNAQYVISSSRTGELPDEFSISHSMLKTCFQFCLLSYSTLAFVQCLFNCPLQGSWLECLLWQEPPSRQCVPPLLLLRLQAMERVWASESDLLGFDGLSPAVWHWASHQTPLSLFPFPKNVNSHTYVKGLLWRLNEITGVKSLALSHVHCKKQ